MIVVDASAAIELLLRTPLGQRVEPHLLGHPGELHVPELLDLEIVQVLRRGVLGRFLTADRADQALADLDGLGVLRHSHEVIRSRIWQLRSNFTAYDAAYVALAEALRAPLLTCDRKIMATRSHGAEVRLVR